MIKVTELLSNFAATLQCEDLSEEVISTTKMYIVDYFAACLAGYKVNKKLNGAMLNIFENMGGKEEAKVMFCDCKIPVENAAFMNAIYAHGADMDDGNRKAMGHVAAHVMPAVFALAETLEVTWADVLVAINVGYEIYNRVAAAAQPGLAHRGFHSTGTAGAIACGAACAKLMGFDSEGIYNSMAIAAIQASGLFIITESGQACKPLNPANAARVGILSAKLTSCGVKGPENPLENHKGWFHAMTDKVDIEMITEGLGEVFTICESYLKPYPSCRHTHCGIDCALDIRKQIIDKYGIIELEKIKQIEVAIYPNAIRVAGQIKVPASLEDAKFSIHYSLAVALMKGRFCLEDLSISDMCDEIRLLIHKIVITEDPTAENVKEGIRGSRVTVTMLDDSRFVSSVLIPKGDATNPFTWTEMRMKLNNCAEGVLTVTEQEELISYIRNIEFNTLYSAGLL